jgi:hypothetical protein
VQGSPNTRAVLTGLGKVLAPELFPNPVNSRREKKFEECYVRAPERDANLIDLPPLATPPRFLNI